MYSRAYNNLGVANYRLAKSSADVDNISLAMACFTKASEYSDLLTRDGETMVRDDAPDLYESAVDYENRNSNNIIDRSGYHVRAAYDIPHNVDDLRF